MRYHEPIRRPLNLIEKKHVEIEIGKELQMAVKSIKDSVGQFGLTPTLLIFGALARLRLPADKPTQSMFRRAIALQNATA